MVGRQSNKSQNFEVNLLWTTDALPSLKKGRLSVKLFNAGEGVKIVDGDSIAYPKKEFV